MGVDHGERRAVGKLLLEGLADLLAVLQLGQAVEDGAEAVLAVEASRQKLLAVLVKDRLEVGAHDVAEDDRVGDLHHGGLQVRGEEHALFLGALDGLEQECVERLRGHVGRVDDLAGLDLQALLEHGAVGHLDGQGVLGRDNDGLLVVAEVAGIHGGNVGLGVLRPHAHGVRVLLGVVLHSLRRAAIRVTLTQHRVHSRTLHSVVLVLSILIIRDVKASSLQLSDSLLQLHQGSGDVRQLDDVGLRRLRQLTQLSQRIRNALLIAQTIRELRENTPCQRNVGGFHIDASLGSKRLHNRLERVGCQQRRFVGAGPNDRRHSAPCI